MSSPVQSAKALPSGQAPTGDSLSEVGSPDGDLAQTLGFLKRAADDCGWNSGALAEYMDRDRRYVERVLDGEKPCGLVFLLALPKDVQETFAESYAKAQGLHVFRPVSADVAVQNFVSGLLAMLATQSVPKRMARADIRPPRVEAKVG